MYFGGRIGIVEVGRLSSSKISGVHGLKPALFCSWPVLGTVLVVMVQCPRVLLSSGCDALLCLISACGVILPKQSHLSIVS